MDDWRPLSVLEGVTLIDSQRNGRNRTKAIFVKIAKGPDDKM